MATEAADVEIGSLAPDFAASTASIARKRSALASRRRSVVAAGSLAEAFIAVS